MAEPAIETKQEDKMVDRENEEKGESHDCDAYLGTNTSFLVELNLVLILSFFSLSAEEECLDFEEINKEENVKYVEAKDTISRLQTRRREINEFKVVERRTPRSQTKIRDCRHCRRM